MYRQNSLNSVIAKANRGLNLILKEISRINLKIDDKRKKDEDKKNHKDNRD